MNRRELFIVAVAAGLISGCATPNNQTAQNTDPDDKTYVTGSRIPVKDNGAQKAAAEKAANNPDKGIAGLDEEGRHRDRRRDRRRGQLADSPRGCAALGQPTVSPRFACQSAMPSFGYSRKCACPRPLGISDQGAA